MCIELNPSTNFATMWTKLQSALSDPRFSDSEPRSTPWRPALMIPTSCSRNVQRAPAEKQIEVFVRSMEHHLGCKRIAFNLNEKWTATPPTGQLRSLDESVGHIYSAITISGLLHNGVDKFIADFAAAYASKSPEISELVRRRLDHGRNVSAATITEAVDAMQAFKTWSTNTLFDSFDQERGHLVNLPSKLRAPRLSR
jgi:hypothetical protein